MEIYLTRVDPNDLADYRRLEEGGELAQYTSRTRPHDIQAGADMLYWRYIECDSRRVGAVWIEKAAEPDEFASLGIFLSPTDLRAKGVGRRAIGQAIAEAQENLGCSRIELTVRENNERGFRCYLQCGFEEKNRFSKAVGDEQVRSIFMVKHLTAPGQEQR